MRIDRVRYIQRGTHRWFCEQFASIGVPFPSEPPATISKYATRNAQTERRAKRIHQLGDALAAKMIEGDESQYIKERLSNPIIAEGFAVPYILIRIREDATEFEALYTVRRNQGEDDVLVVEKARRLCRKQLEPMLECEVCQHCGTILRPDDWCLRLRGRFSCTARGCLWKSLWQKMPAFPMFRASTSRGAFEIGGTFDIRNGDNLSEYLRMAQGKAAGKEDEDLNQWLDTVRIQTSSQTW